MRYCMNCGALLRDTDRFCSSCGASAEAETVKICANCKAELASDQLFCPSCGYRVEQRGPVPPPPDPAPAPSPEPFPGPSPASFSEPVSDSMPVPGRHQNMGLLGIASAAEWAGTLLLFAEADGSRYYTSAEIIEDMAPFVLGGWVIFFGLCLLFHIGLRGSVNSAMVMKQKKVGMFMTCLLILFPLLFFGILMLS